MPSKKRRGRVRFSPATARRKKPKKKKSLSSGWAENLADSNKGLILRPGAMAEGVERAAKRRMRPVGRRFCQGSVELVENLRTMFHLDVPLPERKLSV